MTVGLFDDQMSDMLQTRIGRNQSSGQDRQSDIAANANGVVVERQSNLAELFAGQEEVVEVSWISDELQNVVLDVSWDGDEGLHVVDVLLSAAAVSAMLS